MPELPETSSQTTPAANDTSNKDLLRPALDLEALPSHVALEYHQRRISPNRLFQLLEKRADEGLINRYWYEDLEANGWKTVDIEDWHTDIDADISIFEIGGCFVYRCAGFDLEEALQLIDDPQYHGQLAAPDVFTVVDISKVSGSFVDYNGTKYPLDAVQDLLKFVQAYEFVEGLKARDDHTIRSGDVRTLQELTSGRWLLCKDTAYPVPYVEELIRRNHQHLLDRLVGADKKPPASVAAPVPVKDSANESWFPSDGYWAYTVVASLLTMVVTIMAIATITPQPSGDFGSVSKAFIEAMIGAIVATAAFGLFGSYVVLRSQVALDFVPKPSRQCARALYGMSLGFSLLGVLDVLAFLHG